MKLCPVLQAAALGAVLFCGSHASASPLRNTSAGNIVIYNAKVLTLNSNFAVAQAIAVEGDRILAVGSDREVKHWTNELTRLIDAHGHTVMPGLYDNLVDSYHDSLNESNAPTPVFNSIVEAQQFIRKQAAVKPTNAWIIVEHAYPTRLKEGRLPTKAELDEVAPKHPVYWNCGEISVVNTRALEVSRITTTNIAPPNGEIVLDPKTRKPNGLLRNASSLLKLPPVVRKQPTLHEHREALKRLYAAYNRQGITSIGESDASVDAINLFRDLSKSNELTLRINCTRSITPGTNAEETLARVQALTNTPIGKPALGPTGAGDSWVRIGPLLTRMDGELLNGTAYIRTPWGIGPEFEITEPAYRGQLENDPELLTELYVEAAKRGWQLTADCTGNAALDQLLNCYQKVQFQTNITKRRFLVRRAVFQAAEDYERCRELGVGAEMQPAWLYCDGSMLLKKLGEERLRFFEAFKTSFDQGLLIGGGSGTMAKWNMTNSVDLSNPWFGIWITLTRQTAQKDGIYTKEEQLTRQQALQFYTINNARLHFESKDKGSLEVGKLADLILLDRDIMKCPVDDIRDTKVQLTIVGGKPVWDAKEPAPGEFADPTKLTSLPK